MSTTAPSAWVLGGARSPRAGGPLARLRLGGACLALALALLALGGCGGAAAPALPSGGAGSLAATSSGEALWAEQVLALTNWIRTQNGLEPLVLDEAASQVAYEHAWDMDLRGYFAHVNPDGEGPSERLARHGVEFLYAGENLARGQATPEEVVRAWWESPDHRENLLYPGYTRIGIGVHAGSDRGPWWVQEFLR